MWSFERLLLGVSAFFFLSVVVFVFVLFCNSFLISLVIVTACLFGSQVGGGYVRV